MNTTTTKHVNPVSMLVLLAILGSSPVLAQELGEVPEGVILETGKPVFIDLIRRIMEDPHRGYSNVDGSYDCKSETMYIGTKEVLRKYVESPEEYQAVLRDYVISSKEQCHCTQAIIGKDFDILLHDLGPETSRFRSCDPMFSDPAPGAK